MAEIVVPDSELERAPELTEQFLAMMTENNGAQFLNFDFMTVFDSDRLENQRGVINTFNVLNHDDFAVIRFGLNSEDVDIQNQMLLLIGLIGERNPDFLAAVQGEFGDQIDLSRISLERPEEVVSEPEPVEEPEVVEEEPTEFSAEDLQELMSRDQSELASEVLMNMLGDLAEDNYTEEEQQNNVSELAYLQHILGQFENGRADEIDFVAALTANDFAALNRILGFENDDINQTLLSLMNHFETAIPGLTNALASESQEFRDFLIDLGVREPPISVPRPDYSLGARSGPRDPNNAETFGVSPDVIAEPIIAVPRPDYSLGARSGPRDPNNAETFGVSPDVIAEPVEETASYVPAEGDHLVQLDTFLSLEQAQARWQELIDGGHLDGHDTNMIIQRVEMSDGDRFRLMTGPFEDAEAATAFCEGMVDVVPDCRAIVLEEVEPDNFVLIEPSNRADRRPEETDPWDAVVVELARVLSGDATGVVIMTDRSGEDLSALLSSEAFQAFGVSISMSAVNPENGLNTFFISNFDRDLDVGTAREVAIALAQAGFDPRVYTNGGVLDEEFSSDPDAEVTTERPPLPAALAGLVQPEIDRSPAILFNDAIVMVQEIQDRLTNLPEDPNERQAELRDIAGDLEGIAVALNPLSAGDPRLLITPPIESNPDNYEASLGNLNNLVNGAAIQVEYAELIEMLIQSSEEARVTARSLDYATRPVVEVEPPDYSLGARSGPRDPNHAETYGISPDIIAQPEREEAVDPNAGVVVPNEEVVTPEIIQENSGSITKPVYSEFLDGSGYHNDSDGYTDYHAIQDVFSRVEELEISSEHIAAIQQHIGSAENMILKTAPAIRALDAFNSAYDENGEIAAINAFFAELRSEDFVPDLENSIDDNSRYDPSEREAVRAQTIRIEGSM